MPDLLRSIPRPLYEDIARGRWFPVVGSGLSRNAIVPSGELPPDWNGLAAQLKADLADPDDASDSVDVISAYSHEHGRPALIERVARAIRVADALPGPVHRSLCRLPIDVVMTTNFDNLLEDSFREVDKPCHPIVDEAQLGLTNPFPGPSLLKVHGDISRPERMVLTEGDFDRFLIRNPLLATVVASHFAQRSVVLVGYSLSDPDLRQMLGMVRERLGEGARAIYSLEVDPTASKTARFDRRGVRVVALPGDRHDPGSTLDATFRALYEAIGDEASRRLIPKTHESGLAIRNSDLRRSCFLSCSLDSQSDYFEWLGPASSRLGVPLLTFQDFVSPGDSLVAAVDSMLAASGCAIVEQASAWTNAELGMAINRLGAERVLIVLPHGAAPVSDAPGLRYVTKPQTDDEWASFADSVQAWWDQVLKLQDGVVVGEVSALVGEVVMLSGDLEILLGDLLDAPERERSLSRLLRVAVSAGMLDTRDAKILREFVELRNRVAHGRSADLAVSGLRDLIANVREITARLAP